MSRPSWAARGVVSAVTNLGVTATRRELTDVQIEVLDLLIPQINPVMARHGDCVGGDELFHHLCRDYEIPITIHPPEDPKYRAFCQNAVEWWPEKPYLVRNLDIVTMSDIMIACPNSCVEKKRGSGTWWTVNCTRRAEKPLYIVYPDGHYVLERGFVQ